MFKIAEKANLYNIIIVHLGVYLDSESGPLLTGCEGQRSYCVGRVVTLYSFFRYLCFCITDVVFLLLYLIAVCTSKYFSVV